MTELRSAGQAVCTLLKTGKGKYKPMAKKRMLFIYNPRAGKEKIRSNLLDIIDIFTKAGYEVTAYPTQAKGDGILAVKERCREGLI